MQDGERVDENELMADKFNIYFTSIAQFLSANIPGSNKSFLDYMKPSLQGSFVLNPTTPHELISLSQSLKTLIALVLKTLALVWLVQSWIFF